MVADAVNCLPACLLPSILPFCPPTQSNRAEMQHMEAEIARLQALKEDEAKRLTLLEQENSRLKRIVAEQALDISMLKDLQKGKW